MTIDEKGFIACVEGVLHAFFQHNGRSGDNATSFREFSVRLWGLVRERGLPRPLSIEEKGAPGSMSEAELAPLLDRVLSGSSEPLLVDAARQLVKACFYPEFKTCRDSFREVLEDGSCRRQDLPRVRRRVSGAHCVDCPYWVSLTAEQHEKFLARAWQAGAEEFAAHRDIFLPEEFRALRVWLYSAARCTDR